MTTPPFHRRAAEQRAAIVDAARNHQATDALLANIDGLFAELIADGRLVW